MQKKKKKTYQVSQRIQLLPHHAALLAPARDAAVHEVEEQAGGQEGEGEVEVSLVGGVAEAVPQRREDGHDAAEAVELRDVVGHVQRLEQREVARRRRQEVLLLVVRLFRHARLGRGAVARTARSFRHDIGRYSWYTAESDNFVSSRCVLVLVIALFLFTRLIKSRTAGSFVCPLSLRHRVCVATPSFSSPKYSQSFLVSSVRDKTDS